MATKAKRRKKPSNSSIDQPSAVIAKSDLPSVAQSKKMFHDWLDRERPWAHYDSMYDAMEQIVSAAANCFAGERLYTQAEVDKLSAETMRLTKGLAVHPKGFDGPCLCNECKSYS